LGSRTSRHYHSKIQNIYTIAAVTNGIWRINRSSDASNISIREVVGAADEATGETGVSAPRAIAGIGQSRKVKRYNGGGSGNVEVYIMWKMKRDCKEKKEMKQKRTERLLEGESREERKKEEGRRWGVVEKGERQDKLRLTELTFLAHTLK
jgi:hypothetical protein